MKKYLIQFKPFLLFIGTFFLAYIVLTLVYKFYLNSYSSNKVDGITKNVADAVEYLMRLFNADVRVVENPNYSSIVVYYRKSSIVRIIEGCNAVSIIILFISFIMAFSGKFKTTLLFILFGTIFIYILNVIRIIFLIVLLYRFPEYTHFLHGVLFPLIIYGLIFLLWIVWVTKYSKYAK